jgi:hypothetical protein
MSSPGGMGKRRQMFEMTSFTAQEIASAKAAFRRGSKGRVSFIGMARVEGHRLHVAAQILDRGKPLWMRLVTVDICDDLSAAVMEAGRLIAAYADRDFYESTADEMIDRGRQPAQNQNLDTTGSPVQARQESPGNDP